MIRPVRLRQALSGKGVCVAVLDIEALGVLPLIPQKFPVIREKLVVVNRFQAFGPIHCAVNKGYVLYIQAAVQGICDLHNGALPHAVGNQIRLGIQENGTLQPVRPVIIVGQPAQAGLDPAQNNGLFLVNRADQIGVNHHRVVWPLPHLSPRRIGVLGPALLGHGIMINHGVHISPGHQKPQPGLPQHRDAGRIPPVRLGDHSYLITVGLQNTADNRMAKRRVIHIGIPRHINKIALLPSPKLHVRPADG